MKVPGWIYIKWPTNKPGPTEAGGGSLSWGGEGTDVGEFRQRPYIIEMMHSYTLPM